MAKDIGMTIRKGIVATLFGCFLGIPSLYICSFIFLMFFCYLYIVLLKNSSYSLIASCNSNKQMIIKVTISFCGNNRPKKFSAYFVQIISCYNSYRFDFCESPFQNPDFGPASPTLNSKSVRKFII